MGWPGAYASCAAPFSSATQAPRFTREQQVEVLKEQVKMMQKNVKTAQDRISELEEEKEG
jgi:hypothetical protein